MPQDQIVIRGAREHNLKNIDLALPRDQLIVITGLSGSGKSSLAFDTLFAEGQRRYVESLSSYARQFLGQMDKPDVDHIDGLSPAISIDQKSTNHNPRSTVGTVTEIYDYLRLLYARIGHPHCPKCGRPVSAQTVQQMVDAILSMPDGTRLMLLAPLVKGRKGEYRQLFDELRSQGYVRVRVNGKIRDLSDPIDLDKNKKHNIDVVVDRLIMRAEDVPTPISTASTSIADLPKVAEASAPYALEMAQSNGHSHLRALPSLAEMIDAEPLDESATDIMIDERNAAALAPVPAPTSQPAVHTMRQRVTESVETALKPGEGTILVAIVDDAGKVKEEQLYSEKFACVYDNISIEEIAPRSFSFNNPHGACPECTGIGTKLEVDEELLVINADLTLEQGALGPWQTIAGQSQWYSKQLAALGERHGFKLNTRWRDLTLEQQRYIMHGDKEEITFRYRNQAGTTRQHSTTYEGIISYIEQRYKEGSEHMRAEMEQYMSANLCPKCEGRRLRPEALGVTISGRNIYELSVMSIIQVSAYFATLTAEVLSERERMIAHQILREIQSRLGFLVDVGLDYLTLGRTANSLSGGEAQRIRLATQIGSGLTGVLYILDEPSIGLHQRDNERLIKTLIHLRDIGNTLIVVEHDEDTMRAADHLVDIGPGAGEHGGYVIAQGTYAEVAATPGSITGAYLSGRKRIEIPNERRPGNGHSLLIRGAREHNLKNINVEIPLGKFVVVTGVSGSGKSSLVNSILYPRLAQLNGAHTRPGDHDGIDGIAALDKVIEIDQSPIGRTPRSNPATYTAAFTTIREIFAHVPESRARGYMPGRFSFNIKGGRCEACQGGGIIKIEMNFLPDVYVPCEVCHGKRYNREALEILYKGKSIADVLEMTVEEACTFFEAIPSLANKMVTMRDVGLGYIRLGQPATTLSGGEAQRVKLATELSRRATGRTLYILDEPTTGLHFADVERLLQVLQRLADAGNTIVVIEHNLDVIKSADWIIDLGPDGGDRGGEVVAIGTPEDIARTPQSYTGQFLAPLLRETAGAR